MKKLSLLLAAAMFAPAMVSAQDAAAPAADAASYPRCSATVTDHCTEGGGTGMMAHHKMKHGHHKHHVAKPKK